MIRVFVRASQVRAAFNDTPAERCRKSNLNAAVPSIAYVSEIRYTACSVVLTVINH